MPADTPRSASDRPLSPVIPGLRIPSTGRAFAPGASGVPDLGSAADILLRIMSALQPAATPVPASGARPDWARHLSVDPRKADALPERYEERYVGVDFVDVRYDKIAEAMGCFGKRIEKPDKIRPALEEAKASKLPAVLDVIIDPEINLAPPDFASVASIYLEGCQLPGED